MLVGSGAPVSGFRSWVVGGKLGDKLKLLAAVAFPGVLDLLPRESEGAFVPRVVIAVVAPPVLGDPLLLLLAPPDGDRLLFFRGHGCRQNSIDAREVPGTGLVIPLPINFYHFDGFDSHKKKGGELPP